MQRGGLVRINGVLGCDPPRWAAASVFRSVLFRGGAPGVVLVDEPIIAKKIYSDGHRPDGPPGKFARSAAGQNVDVASNG